METIVFLTQNRKTPDTVARMLAGDWRVHNIDTADMLWETLTALPCDYLFIDLHRLTVLADDAQTDADGDAPAAFKSLLQRFNSLRPMMAVIIIAGKADVRQAVGYVKNGASNYITEPIDGEEIRLVLDEIAHERRQRSELAYLRGRLWQDDSLDIVQTSSPAMKKIYDNVMSVGPTRTTVLLLGETGTGKSFMAKRIHRYSNRRNGPFISVHCGAIPDTLIESELFGHEKGAFTGAHRRKPGKFEVAQGGTIFLDEIGTISMAAQVKLLTVLQEATYQRVGGDQTLTANVRVIAASNADLKQMCDEGQFRKDLYYRLNVFPITIPDLHERREDIPLFVDAFLKKFNQFNNKAIQAVHPDVMRALMQYSWPGNIRELENLIERAYILETTSRLTPDSFPSELFENTQPASNISVDTTATLDEVRKAGLAEIEQRYLQELLRRNRGRINSSAAEAGVGTRQLNKLMHKYGLDKETFKSSPLSAD